MKIIPKTVIKEDPFLTKRCDDLKLVAEDGPESAWLFSLLECLKRGGEVHIVNSKGISCRKKFFVENKLVK